MVDVHHFVEGYVELNVAGRWLEHLHVSAVVQGSSSAASEWNRRHQYDPRNPASIDTSTDGNRRQAEAPGSARRAAQPDQSRPRATIVRAPAVPRHSTDCGTRARRVRRFHIVE